MKMFSFLNHLQNESDFETKVNCFRNETVFIYKSFEIWIFYFFVKNVRKKKILGWHALDHHKLAHSVQNKFQNVACDSSVDAKKKYLGLLE